MYSHIARRLILASPSSAARHPLIPSFTPSSKLPTLSLRWRTLASLLFNASFDSLSRARSSSLSARSRAKRLLATGSGARASKSATLLMYECVCRFTCVCKERERERDRVRVCVRWRDCYGSSSRVGTHTCELPLKFNDPHMSLAPKHTPPSRHLCLCSEAHNLPLQQ